MIPTRIMLIRHHPSLWAALCLTLLLGAPSRAAVSGADPAATAPVVEIDVIGERPGPSMWKVSKDKHVLWIMGTLEPLPKKMTWRSKQVEEVLAQSQEVLPSRPAFGFSWNPISALRVYWQWRGIQKNPDHATLQMTVPPALYARFSALRNKYAPRDSELEELRPMLAALRLFEKGIDASGLNFNHQVQNSVLRLAERRHVRLHKMTLPIDDPRGLLKEIGQIPVQAQIGCLETTVARLESDLNAMKARAAAWAVGDVDALRRLPLPDQQAVCLATLSSSARFKELNEQTARAWMQGAEEALATNASTLALKSIYELIGSGGILEHFRAKGYVVEGP
ncbi:MAG TPA: TraB/GumN family protein [Steroidobacteraceae bacterium]|jgi:uncharacterized protein YbaP (TraB family)|nr:TraB/GumN family protein [Steroidobacteraceae bacterium]